ncbi:hypothetical protein [Haloarcula rubripromontorii]|uniref:hypothetical protein n=1 Tax=Haloarcula rubripromontorii TaxID=1705562 RepID=UPI00197D86BF|nr:hypothetical protein [Haloarcula rubripromontorii]
MNAYTSTESESSVTDGCTDLEKRDVRALTEYMTALPKGGDVYSVTTESGSEYRVDALEERCTCPDYKHNLPTDGGRERCKHLSRVAFATGERPIPKWASPEAIDSQLGKHTDGSIRRDSSPAAFSLLATDGVTTGADKLQTDGGTATVAADSDACPNGDERCDGPDGAGLPCFDCFEVEQ